MGLLNEGSRAIHGLVEKREDFYSKPRIVLRGVAPAMPAESDPASFEAWRWLSRLGVPNIAVVARSDETGHILDFNQRPCLLDEALEILTHRAQRKSSPSSLPARPLQCLTGNIARASLTILE